MRAAFADYALAHESASIRRCWSTWNVLRNFLYTAELIPANPMPLVGRPKATKTLPKALSNPPSMRSSRPSSATAIHIDAPSGPNATSP